MKRPGAGVTVDRERLVRMRQLRLLSRAQLAELMSSGDDEFSITPDAIAKIENGYRRPKTITLGRLCAALGCQPEDILPPDAPPQPQAKRSACAKCGGVYAHDAGCPDAT